MFWFVVRRNFALYALYLREFANSAGIKAVGPVAVKVCIVFGVLYILIAISNEPGFSLMPEVNLNMSLTPH
jgi:hypothetical protein